MRNLLRFASGMLLAGCMVQAVWCQMPLRDFPAGKWWSNRRIIQELGLTPEQQAKIEAIWTQSRRSLSEQRVELEKRQADMAALLGKGFIDEAAAVKAFDGLQQARFNVERTTFLMRIQIKNVLSAEQQPKIEAIAERLRLQKAAATAGTPPVKK